MAQSPPGNPAVFLRKLKPEEAGFLGESAEHYARLAAKHLQVGREPPTQGAAAERAPSAGGGLSRRERVAAPWEPGA